MGINIKDLIVDKWLTWRTGEDKDTRDYRKWYDSTVVWRAGNITNMFENFKHVIEVDPLKFFDHSEPFGWIPMPSARKYFWPRSNLANTAVWRIERVIWSQWDKRWHLNEIGGSDKVFVATNTDKDAIMIALKYT